MERRVNFSHWLEHSFLRRIFGILRLFPYETRVSFLFWFFRFLARISQSVPKRILGGLRQSFPDRDEAWIRSIYRENLKILARMAVDFEEGPRMTTEFMQDHFRYEPNEEEFGAMCRRGGMLILGHLGNWETNGVAITRLLKDNELHVLAKRQSNPLTNDWIEKTRGAQNIKLIYTDESPRVILSHLKKGHLVAFISDQDAGKAGSYYPFFGKLASTFEGPAVFARNTKVPVHFLWSRYTEDGKLVLGFRELPRPSCDPKEQADEWEREFTYNWVHTLEEIVREHPASYFWLHRRWKRQPANPDEVWDFWKKWKAERGLKVKR